MLLILPTTAERESGDTIKCLSEQKTFAYDREHLDTDRASINADLELICWLKQTQ